VLSFSICRHTFVSDRGFSAPRLSRFFLPNRSCSWRQYLICHCARRWRSLPQISARFIMKPDLHPLSPHQCVEPTSGSAGSLRPSKRRRGRAASKSASTRCGEGCAGRAAGPVARTGEIGPRPCDTSVPLLLDVCQIRGKGRLARFRAKNTGETPMPPAQAKSLPAKGRRCDSIGATRRRRVSLPAGEPQFRQSNAPFLIA